MPGEIIAFIPPKRVFKGTILYSIVCFCLAYEHSLSTLYVYPNKSGEMQHMDLKGEYKIPAPREKVWQALNDPAVLEACIPGCDELEMVSPTEFKAKVTTKIGPVKAKFKGTVKLSDINAPESYRISGQGEGGVAGHAKGGADVHLAEADGGTVLTYVANAQVGGKIAQIGSRLIKSTSKKLADKFFSAFSKTVGG
jgi:carbon monoxide dehydrogenase subunit G